MSNLNQFFGNPLGIPPTLLVGNDTTITPTSVGLSTDVIRAMCNVKSTLSGALTATTWKTLVSITGGGVLNFSAVQALDTTARSMGMRITIDGVVVSTRETLDAAMNANAFIPVVGSSVTTTNLNDFKFDPIPFAVSLLIEVRSSLSETDKIAALYNYRTY